MFLYIYILSSWMVCGFSEESPPDSITESADSVVSSTNSKTNWTRIYLTEPIHVSNFLIPLTLCKFNNSLMPLFITNFMYKKSLEFIFHMVYN